MKNKSLILAFFLLFAISLIAQQNNRHIVQRGETPESIAKKYDITVSDLQQANPDIEKFFYVGLKLNIPSRMGNNTTPLPVINDTIDNLLVDNKERTYDDKDNHQSEDQVDSLVVLSGEVTEPILANITQEDKKLPDELSYNNEDGMESNSDSIDYKSLLVEYIEDDNVEKSSRVNELLSSMDDTGRKEARTILYEKIISYLEKEKKDKALSLIPIYQNITDLRDENLPVLLFVKGNIYAEMLDSANLKKTIDELENNVFRESDNVANYIATLNSQLSKFVPVFNKLNGIWVADDLYWYGWKKNRISTSLPKSGPDMIAALSYDDGADTLSFCIKPHSNISREILIDMSNVKSIKNNSQIAIPLTSDSLYFLWSSEKINRNSPEFAPLFRGAVTGIAAGVSAKYAQKNKYNFGEQLLSSTVTTIAETGLNAAISVLFTPTTRMYVLEARLKIENDYLLTGTLTYNYKWIAADGTIYENKNMTSRIKLVRWFPESNVIFADPWILPVFHPSEEMEFRENIMNRIPKSGKKIKLKQYNQAVIDFLKDKGYRYAYCKDKIGDDKIFSSKSVAPYNNDQYKWLQLFNDSILLSLRYKGKYTVPEDAVPYIGMKYDNITEKIQKKNNLESTRGVIITNVEDNSPAYLAGIKEKDVILSVNDKSIINMTVMTSILEDNRIGDWVRLQVLRKKEVLDLLLRVTWK